MKVANALMSREWRLVLAFLAASVAPAIVIGCWYPLSEVRTAGGMAASAMVLLPYSGAAVVLVGGSLYALCAKMGLVRWWTAVGAGILGSVLVSYLVAPAHEISGDTLSVYACAGVAAGAAFWLVCPLGHGGENERTAS